jgi:SAM-dependent methyltransferase
VEPVDERAGDLEGAVPGAVPAAVGGPRRTRISVVSTVERYRRLAGTLPAPGDAVLEIGCSTGEATRLLAATAARVLAVDVSAGMVERARAAAAGLASVTVAHLDGRDTAALAALLPRPDLVFVDVGGDARLDAVALQLRQCLLAFAPRALVVRSAELAAICAALGEVEAPEAGRLGPARSQDPRAHALESLLDLSHSSGVRNRVFAARKLRAHAGDSPAARARLAELAQDPDPRVRRIARAGPPATRRRRSGAGGAGPAAGGGR